jgi:hypothetical protein
MGAFLRDRDPEREAKNREFGRQFRRIHFLGLAIASAVLCFRFGVLMTIDGVASVWGILEIVAVVLLGASVFAFTRLARKKS